MVLQGPEPSSFGSSRYEVLICSLLHKDLAGRGVGYRIPLSRPCLDPIWGLLGVSRPLHPSPPTLEGLYESCTTGNGILPDQMKEARLNNPKPLTSILAPKHRLSYVWDVFL